MSYNDLQVLFKKSSVVCDEKYFLRAEVLQTELKSHINAWDRVFIASKHQQKVRNGNGNMKDGLLIPKPGTFKYEWGLLPSSIFCQEIWSSGSPFVAFFVNCMRLKGVGLFHFQTSSQWGSQKRMLINTWKCCRGHKG